MKYLVSIVILMETIIIVVLLFEINDYVKYTRAERADYEEQLSVIREDSGELLKRLHKKEDQIEKLECQWFSSDSTAKVTIYQKYDLPSGWPKIVSGWNSPGITWK